LKKRVNPTLSPAHLPELISIVDAVEDYAIFMLDPEGNIATWNRGAELIKGYAASEIIGKHFSAFYLPGDVADGKPERELMLARRDGRVEDEGLRVRKDGSLFWANVVITALFDNERVLTGYTKVTRDLTARRAAEEELRRSEERFRLLVESVVDYAMYMLDASGMVTTWNAGAENLKGYPASEVIGKHFSLFFPEEDVRAGKPQRELAVSLAEGRFEDEGYRIRRDGTMFWANVILTPIRDARGELLGFAKVTRDLTARREAERTARELVREQVARSAAEAAETRVREAARLAEVAAERAEHANRAKDEFLATVSHELRTPLNAIVGWSSLLRSRNTDASLAKGLDVIHRNALAQSRLIDDILDLSRIITGKLRLDVKPTDLVAIVQDAIEVIRPAAIAKNLAIDFPVPERDGFLVADPERLRQVVWNLLSNATKFSDPDGKITIKLVQTNADIALTVSDTGRGIDPDFIPFVFERFKQADSSATRRVGGLGLGLSIVRHLVALHGGQVEVQSDGIGKGASFTVFLPLCAPSPVRATADEGRVEEERAPPVLGHLLDGRRVLVVDDEEDARELLVTVLTTAGAVVEAAASASEAIASVRRFRPDVLVSDIGMPGEDGYSLVRRVALLAPEDGGGIPSIALTAYTRNEDKAKALATGFTIHLGKPVDPEQLVASIVNLANLTHR
jgi:PAS domain S-box-containing protein